MFVFVFSAILIHDKEAVQSSKQARGKPNKMSSVFLFIDFYHTSCYHYDISQEGL